MRFWLLFAGLLGFAVAFVPSNKVAPRTTCVLGAEDPTKVWYADLANTVQNVLTNSPLNEGKKLVVKLLAGPYDEAATRAKIEKFASTEPVAMLSFTK